MNRAPYRVVTWLLWIARSISPEEAYLQGAAFRRATSLRSLDFPATNVIPTGTNTDCQS